MKLQRDISERYQELSVPSLSQKGHAFPARLSWLIDGRLRRWIQPADKLVEQLGVASETTVVDFGCGPGYFTVELAKRAHKVIAVDLQQEMLKKAQRKIDKAGLSNVEYLRSDGANIQLPDASVDMVLLVTVFHEIGDIKAVLAEFRRILKLPGKLFIVEMTEKGGIPFAPLQDPKVLKGEIEDEGFQLENFKQQKRFGVLTFSKKTEAGEGQLSIF